MIYNFSICTRISNAINGKEDNLFSACKKTEEGNPLIENDIEDLKEEEIDDSDSADLI